MDTQDPKQLLRDRGICVVIPTYNNAGTIADVVSRSMVQCHDVIVVCDGCTDGTMEILENLPERPVIIDLKVNKGKGSALKAGFRYALKTGFSYAVTLDGDGQHFPEDIPLLLKANMENPGALIVGQRKDLENAVRSKGSKFANSFSNFWFAVQTGRYLKDTQTGYRLYPLRKLRWLSLLPSRYEAELALMVVASWHGVRLVSEPVNVYYPPMDERVSHFRPGRDFMRITILNMVLCLLAVIYGLPAAIFRYLTAFLCTVYAFLVFIIGTMFILTPAMYLYMGVGKMTERKRYNLHRIMNFMAKFILIYHKFPGARYSLDNRYGEDFSRPAVIICNHQSHLDLLPLLALTPKMVVLTAGWVWHNPMYSYAIHQAEFYPVTMNLDELMPRFRSLAERGYSIAVYPEGTRSMDCSIGRFHQGAFHIAAALGLDIIPLVLYGTGKILPKKGRLLRKGMIHLEIGRRISPEELRNAVGPESREQASYMRKYCRKRYGEIANKIEQYV